MRDTRLEKLAQVLVGYSVAVKPGDLVRISGSSVTEPLVVALYCEVVRAGGHPVVRMPPDDCHEIFLRTATEEQLRFVDPIQVYEIEHIDCSIGIWGDANTKSLTTVNPTSQATVSKAREPISQRFLRRAAEKDLRWVGTEFPTQAAAQDAEMSLSEFEDFVFAAGLLHLPDPAAVWRKVQQRQQLACETLNQGRELRFVTRHGTDLTVGIEGRRWINGDGHNNFPDGEVFSGPIEEATRGTLCLTFPAVYGGREVTGARLEFRQGKVVQASADKGEEFLIAMLDQDAGARILGEVAFGTNYSVTRFMKNLTFDEKFGGTFHVALGASYPETGGQNQSGLHWDLVCDLRDGGQVFLDGRLISQDGLFSDPRWPQPHQ